MNYKLLIQFHKLKLLNQFFLEKKKPRIVEKMSFVKSNGIKFVSLDRLIAFCPKVIP